jgi:hypothetical protein
MCINSHCPSFCLYITLCFWETNVGTGNVLVMGKANLILIANFAVAKMVSGQSQFFPRRKKAKPVSYNFLSSMNMTNKMQLCTIIYCSLAPLHASSDVFAHHQEHLNCIYSFWYYLRVSLPAGVIDELEMFLF